MSVAVQNAPMDALGQVIAERYRIVKAIGKGAMGTVYRAEHLTLKAPVAVKLIDPTLLDPSSQDREEVVRRFLREAQSAAALRSPHVVQILDHGIADGVPYMVMELLEGETLEQRVERVGPLPYRMIAHLMTHVARALGKAHEVGIVHRDLKPGNIFITKNDEEEVAKVLDFGIAKWTGAPGGPGAATETKVGFMVGTPAFMSPEQASGIHEVDYRTDLWAMGVIAFQCITGKLPFFSDAVGELILQICAKPIPVPSKVGRVPDGFDIWFGQAVNRDRTKRFKTAREAAEALKTILSTPAADALSPELPTHRNTNPPSLSGPQGATTQAVVAALDTEKKPADSSRMLMAVGGLALLALLGAAGYVATGGSIGGISASADHSTGVMPVSEDELRRYGPAASASAAPSASAEPKVGPGASARPHDP
jgi:eukaryotic-like serine/threonine-protein kinase